jgi:hypothetical protein
MFNIRSLAVARFDGLLCKLCAYSPSYYLQSLLVKLPGTMIRRNSVSPAAQL